MQDSPKNLIDDLLALGSNLFGNALNARHELKSQVSQRGEQLSRMLGLVSREEFDAAFAMLAKARTLQDELAERLTTIEKQLGIRAAVPASGKATKTPPSAMKANLRSVKKDKRKV